MTPNLLTASFINTNQNTHRKYRLVDSKRHLLLSTCPVPLLLCCCCQVASVVSDSVRPHRWQPTRLPRPWDSPGKNSGVGCHFLLQCMKVKSESCVRLLATPWTAAHRAPPSIQDFFFPAESLIIMQHLNKCWV